LETNRNVSALEKHRIKTRTGSQWLTVPVGRGGEPRIINQVVIDAGSPWRRKHRDAILQGYAGTAGLPELVGFIEQSYAQEWSLLVDLNIHFITGLQQRLGIDTPLVRSSEHPSSAGRIARLATLCRKLGADEYLSPAGAHDYLDAGEELQRAGIRLCYHDYEPQPYRQLHPPFVPYLSVLDLMLNEGPDSLAIIRRGRRPLLSPTQLAGRRQGAMA